MSQLFIKLFNISLTAGWIVLAVVLLRAILQKAPKWTRCLLWGVVALRLVFPFSLESVLSLIPSAEPLPQNITITPTPVIHTGLPPIDEAVNPILSQTLAPTVTNSVNPMQVVVGVASWVWVVGIALMLLFAVISYVRLYLRVRPSIRYRDNIYVCDNVDTPFLLGIVKPRIYLPSGLSEEQSEHVIAHERAHICRWDHLWKPLGFLLLTVYWFNPIIWIAYILLCRDIELACDEKVIRSMSVEAKKSYSEALVACSVHRRLILACPLAFGEVGVKNRIKSVLNYKKPAFWIILLALIASVVLAVCFLTDPPTDEKPQEENPPKTEENSPPTTPTKLTILKKGHSSEYSGIWLSLHEFEVQNNHYLFHTKWGNYSEKQVTYGERYTIEYLDGDTWRNTATEEIVFHMIGILLDRNNTAEKTYSTEKFDLSRIGRYRLRSEFSVGDGKTYSASIDFFVAPAVPDNGIYTMHNITEKDIRVVRDKYPQYFNLDASQGLTVYVHPSTNGNTCQLVSGKDPVPTGEQLTHMTGTTIPEMRAILTAYEIPSNSISIVPYRLPYSVLTYITDEKTIKEITGAFGIAPQSYNAEVNDCIIFDIDNDGADELCVVLSLPNFTSSTRLFIYALSVRELTDAQDEYYYTWGAQYQTDLSFQIGKNEKLQIQETEKYTDSSKTALIDIDIKNGRILRIEESP